MGTAINKLKEKSTKKNYIYNLLYQIFMLIIPLVVTPYVSITLGEDGIGRYSFSYAIIRYFILFGSLGFAYYAQRLIAKHQGDKVQQSKDFWGVMIAKLIPVGIAVVIHFVLIILNVYGEIYNTLMLIYTIELVSVGLDTVFFFYGNEEFGKVVVKKVVVQVIAILCIFLFVKDEGDVWVYAVILVGSVFAGCLVLLAYMPKYLVKVSIKEISPLKHLKPSLMLFLPVVATQVYAYLDKILIGLITNNPIENGNYEVADTLIRMALTVVTSLGIVMLPHNAHKLATGDKKAVEQNIYSASRFVWFLGVPLMLGCVAVVDNLVPWYLGGGYDKTANIMKILSPIIIFMGLSNVLGAQYMLASGRDKQFAASILLGMIINVVLNIVFITMWQSYGAALATTIAELCVVFIMSYLSRKEIKFTKILATSWKYLLSGGIMFVACYFFAKAMPIAVYSTLLTVLIGIIVYGISLLLMKEVYVCSTIKKVFRSNKSIETKVESDTEKLEENDNP